ncbi:MAG TPA: DNA cytosine methyltransferase [Acetobacteraceae bacterium]|nr:DNA cytosine methyltransferase [Acetobacteraceae bacterium]
MIYPQLLLDVHDELIVDLFAGGGGASVGIEIALGRQVDVAINHDPAAVAMHRVNHPQTQHHVCDVFEADPRAVTNGRRVGLLWASPDCTYHSKARGAKPIRSKDRKRRALAWVVTRWAGQVRPRVIFLENVEELAGWGPLVGPPDALRPCPRRRGKTFRKWVRSLERFGYTVEWRELRACDYGAPTIRKRLFLIARCDGQPIVWPEPTHGPPGRRRPFRTAAECIDWSIPMLSIFATKEEAREWAKEHGQAPPIRPLAEATQRRIARGVMRYVVQNPKPFLVTLNHGGGKEHGSLAAVHLSPYHAEKRASDVRGAAADEPVDTVDTANRHALVASFIARHNAGYYEGDGRSLEDPAGTVCAEGSPQGLVATTLAKMRGTGTDADPAEPLHTVSAGGMHHALATAHIASLYSAKGAESRANPADSPLRAVTATDRHAAVYAFLQKYYGQGVGQQPGEPIHTIPTVDRFGLVTVNVRGVPHYIADIAMRMLQPRELYRAQGFPDGYVIDRGADGRRLTKTEQVRMCGNSVCPPVAAALVRANVPGMIARDEALRSRVA